MLTDASEEEVNELDQNVPQVSSPFSGEAVLKITEVSPNLVEETDDDSDEHAPLIMIDQDQPDRESSCSDDGLLPSNQNTTTNLQAMMHILKGNIGTGILAMPIALKYAGLWVGFFGLALISVICVHCMHLLVLAAHHLCQQTGCKTLDYGQVVEQAFTKGPARLQRFGSAAKVVVNVFITFTQFGFCIVYILFVAQNLQQIFVHLGWDVRLAAVQALLLIFLVPYSFVKSLKYLAPFSMFANLLTAFGLTVVMQYCFRNLQPLSEFPAFNSIRSLPLFFGIAVYAFEGIAVVLPVENKMATPRDLLGLNGVLNTAMVIVTVLYMAVGFYGYLCFGSLIEPSITLNLPVEQILYLLMKLSFAVAVFISYGIQFYVPAYILIPHIHAFATSHGFEHPLVVEYGSRTFFVLITFLLSATIPHLDLMISLIGALASSALALMIPPIIDLLVRWPGRLNGWIISKNILIFIFGFLGFITGTGVTLYEIGKAMS